MRSRKGCCANWPKPCGYHEGYQDAVDEMETEMELGRKAMDALESYLRHRFG